MIAAVDFARSNDLPLAVRGGGYSPAGYGTIDGGLVIDLSRMKRLDVDRELRVASAQGGLTWGEYNARTHVDGLATPGGDVATVPHRRVDARRWDGLVDAQARDDGRQPAGG